MNRLFRLCLLAGAALASAGCLDFEQQTLVMKVEPDGKSAQCLLVYEGLRVAGDKDDSLQKAKQELAALVGPQPCFYLLSNWPLRVNLAPEPGGALAEEQQKVRLRKLLAVKPGNFFYHGPRQERLGYSQLLSTSDLPSLLREVNRFAADHLVEMAKDEREAQKEGEGRKLSETTLRMWSSAPDTRPEVVRWKSNQLTILIPTTGPDAETLKKEMTSDLKPEMRQMLEKNKISVAATPFGVRLTVGAGGAVPLTIRFREPEPESPSPFTPQLLAFARTLPPKIAPGQTAERLVAEFLAGK